MRLLQWLAGRLSSRGQGMGLYKRGMVKARRHDYLGAIEDYTSTILRGDTPASLRAMALYNRALAYTEAHQNELAVGDLNEILNMLETLPNIKIEARRRLLRMQRRADTISNHQPDNETEQTS